MKNQGTLKQIKSIRYQVEKCIGCGSCLFSCPVYCETADEEYSPRGRNHLIKGLLEDFQDLATGAADRFDKCLLCGSCTMACPQGVRNDLITLAARGERVKHDGLSLAASLAFRQLLKNRGTMKRAMRMAGALQWVLPSARTQTKGSGILGPQETGKIRHIPALFAGAAGAHSFPSVARTFLSDRVPEINAADPGTENKGIRVAYFSGCATEFVFPSVGEALIGLLTRSGIEVIFPKKQGCCGAAVHANGDVETARELALHNLRVLADVQPDYIVTGCATCGSALKEGWPSLLSDQGPEAELLELVGKIRDVSEFLVEAADLKPLRYRSLLPENTRVTYHDACHLAHHQAITEQPRRILRQVFGNRFVEMDNNGCCGFGGSFALKNQALSRKIGQDKIESIERTRANVVITTCPGCMIQLIDGIEQNHLSQRVMHLANAVEPS